MLVKDLRKVQAYCAGQQQGRHSGKVRIYWVTYYENAMMGGKVADIVIHKDKEQEDA